MANENADPAQVSDQTVAPDATLAALYRSDRPAVELVPGVPLSAVINAVWLPADAKTMLAETWQQPAPEPEEGKEPVSVPSFNPAAPEYNEMARRVAKSAALQRYNQLMIEIKTMEVELEKEKDEKVKEEKTAALETARATLPELEAALAELRNSFNEDPTSLTPWMCDLFNLADAGITTCDVSGPFFPHVALRALFSDGAAAGASSPYAGAEAVLGAFKRRYERERGPGKIQLLTRLVPNMFSDTYSGPAYVESVVERIRQAVFGAESAEPLDLVQLFWWDTQEGDVQATLKALQKLSEDVVEVGEGGEPVVTVLKKVKAIGLVDFPPRAIISAVQAGVPLVSVSIPLNLADRRYEEVLAVAKEYNIKVFARDGLMGGLISEKYVGAAVPSTTSSTPDADLDDVAATLDMVNNYGGWDAVQAMLRTVQGIAKKHGVRMQSVALRWQIDQGTFPVVTSKWGDQAWTQFGHSFVRGSKPGLDTQLFQVDSFLDATDAALLHALGRWA